MAIKTENQPTATTKDFGGKLQVQIKQKRMRRQYRRNQDAVNFLRRFTLAVVIIDLILSISESSLMSTFFLYLTLSTTFEVKPENVIDLYCHHYQGGGNAMCENFMERVTGYTAPSSTMNHLHRPSTGNSPQSPVENHFPTTPSRSPLTPAETRKLFQVYNLSLHDPPTRFTVQQKIDQDSKLSKLYTRFIYLLFENNGGILNGSLHELLKNDKLSSGDVNFPNAMPIDPESPKSKQLLTELLISKHLKQSLEIMPPQAELLTTNRATCMLFRLCSKTLDKQKALLRLKPKKKNDTAQVSPTYPAADKSSLASPSRKNFIQPKDFIRHRWKRSAVSPESIKNSTAPSSGNVGTNVSKKTGMKLTTVSGAGGGSMLGEAERTVDAVGDSEQQEGEKQGNSATSNRSRNQHFRGSGFRLLKGQSNKLESARYIDIEEQGEILEDYNYYDAAKATLSRRGESSPDGHGENPPIMMPSREQCKRDIPVIFSLAEGNFDNLLLNKVPNSKPTAWSDEKDSGGKVHASKGKYLDELALELDKNPRQILSLMESVLFYNWQRFVETSKRLPLYYRTDDNDVPLDDKDEALGWVSVRQKISENLLLNAETNIFSPETLQKAERRKRAMEQIYHDYSFSILGELENVKEMPVSRTFQNIYWAIKCYVLLWQMVICTLLFVGSICEDKTALSVWGIFSILTSLLHFMVDDWINTNFHPEKTSASIWLGVIYGVYKPITILLVGSLSSEIFKKDTTVSKGLIERLVEVIKGRKRPPLISGRCLAKLKGVFITAETMTDNEGGSGKKKNVITTSAITGDNKNGNIVYTGIKVVKIRAQIKRMEVQNGDLIVITQTTAPNAGVKNEVSCGNCCGSYRVEKSCTVTERNQPEKEKTHEGRLFFPSAPLDNDDGMTAEELFQDDTEEDEDDEDELHEVIDENDDDSDDEDGDDDDGKCSYDGFDTLGFENELLADGSKTCKNENVCVLASVELSADMNMRAEGKKMSGTSAGGTSKLQSGISLIPLTGTGIQGNLLHDSNTMPAPDHKKNGGNLSHGSAVDGGNLYI